MYRTVPQQAVFRSEKREAYRNIKFDRFMHKTVLLALLFKTARTVSFTVIYAVFMAIFVLFFDRLALKTLNDQNIKTLLYM